MQASAPIGLSTPSMAAVPLDLPANPKASPKDAAKAFESLFASVLIKQMRQTLIPGQGLFGHDPGDVLGGLFDHFMSQHITQKGSLGIGAVIERHLEGRSAKT
ncbi:MAG TPA: rod-binding protein [Gemmataceae bacterium]|nr:rod-binding protein [Gemmataceae bacterium]